MSYDRVEYEIWTSSDSRQGMKFIKNFHQYYTKLINSTLFTPHYVTWTWDDWDEDLLICYCAGDYCAKGFGRKVIYEDLVQLCVFDTAMDYGVIYFEYVVLYLKLCGRHGDLDCSNRVYIYIYILYIYRSWKNWELIQRK